MNKQISEWFGRSIRQLIGAIAFGVWQNNYWAGLAMFVFLVTIEDAD